MVDAALGEVLTTCEKIAWLLSEGERWLRPERRSVGRTMLHKVARVEYKPLGVLGAIVPWNYPFHNLFNPILAGVFAGNAVVVKVRFDSESCSHRWFEDASSTNRAVFWAPLYCGLNRVSTLWSVVCLGRSSPIRTRVHIPLWECIRLASIWL